MFKRKINQILPAVLIAILLVCISIFSVVSASSLNRQNYSQADDGYHLIRDEVNGTCYIDLPNSTNVLNVSKTKRAILDTVQLDYQYTEPGTNNNWDIYFDESGNKYTFHEVTGNLVSILFNNNEVATYSSDANTITKDAILDFSESYLTSIVDAFEDYELVSYKESQSEDGLIAGNAYVVKYGIPVGDYFWGDQIVLRFSANGNLTDVSLSQNAPIQLSDQEKSELNNNLPTQSELLSAATTHLAEEYGGSISNINITNTILVKTVTGFELRCMVEYTTQRQSSISTVQTTNFNYVICF